MKSSIRTKKWWTLIILVVFIVMTAGMEAMAKPKDKTAKQLISEGAKAYEKDDYDTALAKFEEAYNMEQTTSLLYNLGRVNESKGEFSTAMAYYRNYVTAPDADEDARTDALERIEQLEKIITIQNGGSLTGANINTNTNTKAAPKGAAKANKAAAPAGGCININTASASELEQLNKIGPAKAKQIVELRGTMGSFKSVDDLGNIKGIGPKTIDGFRDQVCPLAGGGSAQIQAVPKTTKAAPKAAAPAQKKVVAPSVPSAGVVDI